MATVNMAAKFKV